MRRRYSVIEEIVEGFVEGFFWTSLKCCRFRPSYFSQKNSAAARAYYRLTAFFNMTARVRVQKG
jgi:hypothetical protein